MFAHNTQFDFLMLDGFNQLLHNGWQLKSHYVKSKTFILVFKKLCIDNKYYTLHIWDTMNYVPESLDKIGISVGYPKLSIDFDKVSDKELEIYCMRDTEIIYEFIKKLINFLEVNDLSRLKATSGSLSFNTFRHKFYKPETHKIYIHDWKRAIKLERESYKGGITDCFKIGTHKDLYKLDINSMYPSIMRKSLLPIKLLFSSHESNYSQKDLFKIYKLSVKKGYGCIIKATINLNYNNPYILHNFGTGKALFSYGTFKVSICQPEIDFIMKYGKILTIHEINVYKMKVIFKDFVDFFYKIKTDSQKNNDKITTRFAKLMLNTQYGKWGQRQLDYMSLDITHKFMIEFQEVIKLMIIKMKEKLPNFNLSKDIVYLGSIINEGELYIVNGKLYLLKQTNSNAKDSFVAIASFITSYSRMLLIDYLKIAKRKNVFYVDTDSLFVNQSGYNNLEKDDCINEFGLGKLKLEETGVGSFYAPKFYDFNDNRKIKGINQKSSIILLENNKKVVYQVHLWKKFKSNLKDGYKPEQEIQTTTKESKKYYDKGKIDDFNNVIPFSVREIELMIK